jgi:DNA (cytosine-5)-methyltransferase 1
MPLPVIDLFAGPGGLAEGFSSFVTPTGHYPFRIALSIESDKHAHATLLLRSFTRQFPKSELPLEYYQYIQGSLSRAELFDRYPSQARAALNEAWLTELGRTDSKVVDDRIRSALEGSDNWILIGGPPCQAYSTVGRSRMRGADKEKFEKDERHFLYREYLHILRTHSPKIFVLENVKGILSSKVGRDRIFGRILFDLSTATRETPGYSVFSFVVGAKGSLRPIDLVVHAERFGVPQARHRVLILGVRNDMQRSYPFLPSSFSVLTPAPPPTVEDAISDLPKLRSCLSREPDSYSAWRSVFQELLDFGGLGEYESDVELKLAAREAGQYPAPDNLGHARYMKSREPWQPSKWLEENRDWFYDPNLQGVCNHTTRAHMRHDLLRYLFAACYAKTYTRSPKLPQFPAQLIPNHRTAKTAITSRHGFFGDRFRVQTAGSPATTIVSHIAKDGHYYIHPDPSQCRSLTPREAARLQTFPDNYFFEGPRTEQYRQIGNAVPPLLARQLAASVFSLVRQFSGQDVITAPVAVAG